MGTLRFVAQNYSAWYYFPNAHAIFSVINFSFLLSNRSYRHGRSYIGKYYYYYYCLPPIPSQIMIDREFKIHDR